MAESLITQCFGQAITNNPSAQSLKSLPNQDFSLYDEVESLRTLSEKGIPQLIRAIEPRKPNIVSTLADCGYNFY